MLLDGAIKYSIFTPLTLVGAFSMHVYGGGIVTFVNTLGNLFSGDYIEAFLTYYITSALPPTSISNVIINILVGTFAASIKWLIAMHLYHS